MWVFSFLLVVLLSTALYGLFDPLIKKLGMPVPEEVLNWGECCGPMEQYPTRLS